MKGIASGLLRSALTATRHATKAAVKATGEGVKEGIKGATKNIVKEHALKYVRGSVPVSSAPMQSITESVIGSYVPHGGILASSIVRQQQYPASCECDFYAGAPRTPSGKKILTCHSCAPKGMGARDYQRMLEASTMMPLNARPRKAPSYYNAFEMPPIKETKQSHSRGNTHSRGRGRSLTRRRSRASIRQSKSK